MFPHERQSTITDLLGREGKMTVAQLQVALGASSATLRRDLAALEEQGQVVRVHGAVVHPHLFRGEATLAQKARAASAAKRSIAAAAAKLVPQGATVLLDAGTTTLEVGRLLLARSDLTLVTHSLPLLSLALEGASARVLSLGGEVRRVSGALVGALALSWLDHVRADWCFLGASGLHPQDGAFTTEPMEAGVKSALLGRAPQRVLLADARKWNKPATVRFGAWSDFNWWISDLPSTTMNALNVPTLNAISVEGAKR